MGKKKKRSEGSITVDSRMERTEKKKNERHSCGLVYHKLRRIKKKKISKKKKRKGKGVKRCGS